MTSAFEQQQIAHAAAYNSLPHGNPYPVHGDRAPVIKLPLRKVRALSASFFVDGAVAETGNAYAIPADEARGLVARGLAEWV